MKTGLMILLFICSLLSSALAQASFDSDRSAPSRGKKFVRFGCLTLSLKVAEALQKRSIFSEQDLSQMSTEQLVAIKELPQYGALEVIQAMEKARKHFKSSDISILLREKIDSSDVLKLNAAGVYTLNELRGKSVRWIESLFPIPEVKNREQDRSRHRLTSETVVEFLRSVSARVYHDDLEIAIHKGAMETPIDEELMGLTGISKEELGPDVNTVGDLLRRMKDIASLGPGRNQSAPFKRLNIRIQTYLRDCQQTLAAQRRFRPPPPILED
jgi:hypothetical protein